MLTPKLQLGLQGLGASPCDINFVGLLTPEQQATCLAQIPTTVATGAGDQAGITNDQLTNIKDFYYKAGQDSSPDVTPTFIVIGGALLFVMLISMGKR
jgi:hypothetical protein